MVTADEEIQAKEFLKRAEIRTMKKDLLGLREVDALKERDKIVKIKTLEEQLEEKRKINESASAKASADKVALEEVLQKNEGQERIAEKDLKDSENSNSRKSVYFKIQKITFCKETITATLRWGGFGSPSSAGASLGLRAG